MSQGALAGLCGVSQATISRLEASEEEPSDIRVLSRIGRALGIALRDLVPERSQPISSLAPFEFYAYCPNPHCSSNNVKIEPKGPVVEWKSWKAYPEEDFVNINFCGSCGAELLKECPNCRRRFTDKYANYCITCGQTVWRVLTEEERELLF